MMVGDPCPMHKHFHTILGLMDAQDPLLSYVHHGRNRLPRLLTVIIIIIQVSNQTLHSIVQ